MRSTMTTLMSGSVNPKSYVRVYWIVWLIFVLIFLLVRFSAFSNSSEGELFVLFIVYAIPTWVVVAVLNLYEGHKLREYLRKNHSAKWEYLTYIPFFGSGGYNGFRLLPFLYSKDDLGDPNVAELKKRGRRFIVLALTIFFTMPLIFLAIMLS